MKNTLNSIAITVSGSVINGLLGLAFYPLVARLTGVSDFGAFSISVLTMTLVADIANVGTDTGIVRFVGKYLNSDTQRAYKYLKFGLKLKLLIGLVVVLVGWIILPWITKNLLFKSELIEPLRIGLLGSCAMILFTFSTSALQVLQKFKLWTILNISLNTFRLILVIVIGSLGLLSVNTALAIFAILPLLGFLISFKLLPNFLSAKNENQIAREFLHYNKWVALFVLLAAVSSRLDSYITARYLSLDTVGIYAAAVSLASVGPQIVSAIATVIAPKLTQFENKGKLLSYLKKLQIFLILLGTVGMLLGSISCIYFIPLFFGDAFVGSITPFIILLAAQMIFLVSIPIHTSVIYYYAKPQVFVWVTLIHLAIIYFLGSLLIPSYGVVGAATTVLIGNISNLLLPGVWLLNKVINDKN